MNKLAVSIGQEFFRQGVVGPINHKLLSLSGVGDVVSLILGIAFVVAGIVLLVSFIIAGIGLISGAGQNNPEKLEKGKQAITSTVIGFVVVFTAYWIVKLIGQVTGLELLK